ncbi:MAG: hypothetical protein NT087_13830 [Deltaproteobacteria bacterium]|nr:hypothetical protein [Deltaproteobacteria bacterium]
MTRKVYMSILFLQLLAGASFVISGWQGDRALDKSGIGDPEKFTFWNQIAGGSFYLFVVAWLSGIAMLLYFHVLARKKTDAKPSWQPSNRGLWVPPLLLSLGWLIGIL